MGESVLKIEEVTAVAETIRRDIENAHDERALTDGQITVFDVPGASHV
jgi:hypothetical protein